VRIPLKIKRFQKNRPIPAPAGTPRAFPFLCVETGISAEGPWPTPGVTSSSGCSSAGSEAGAYLCGYAPGERLRFRSTTPEEVRHKTCLPHAGNALHFLDLLLSNRVLTSADVFHCNIGTLILILRPPEPS
jgi:hypothetical protein